MKLTTKQQGTLIHRSERKEPRRNLKRYLKDLGGSGSAEELDEMLKEAFANDKAIEEARRMDNKVVHVSKTVELGLDARVAEMIGDIRVQMETQGITQAQLAEFCGFAQPLANQYLNGNKEPGVSNLAKMASAVGCVWRLQKEEAS